MINLYGKLVPFPRDRLLTYLSCLPPPARHVEPPGGILHEPLCLLIFYCKLFTHSKSPEAADTRCRQKFRTSAHLKAKVPYMAKITTKDYHSAIVRPTRCFQPARTPKRFVPRPSTSDVERSQVAYALPGALHAPDRVSYVAAIPRDPLPPSRSENT